MPPSGVDYASEFLNGYAPEYVLLKPFNAKFFFLRFGKSCHSLNFLFVVQFIIQ